MNRILAFVAITASLALAQTTRPTQADIDAHRAKVDQAIESRDYEAWKTEHETWNPDDTRLTGKITAENFEKFAQMREARKNGDMTTARQLRDELEISAGGNGKGKGMGQGQGKGNGSGKGKGQGQGNCQGNGQGKRGNR